jgi:gliding motility-associated-like protein
MKKVILIFFLSFFYLHLQAQEVCDNGIDDDGDGLIDLLDTTDCSCHGLHGGNTQLQSFIPNPSFEQQHCCPFTYSQMNCATNWMQASFATSDYMSHCPGGYVGGAVASAGLNTFPDGDAIVGCIFQPNWLEYVGSCLNQPLVAGTSYTIRLNIASTPVDGQGGQCNGGTIFYGPVDITIFGSTSCANLPFSGTACPAAPAWRIMGHATYTPQPHWSVLTITFTPNFTANAIILGAPCALPASYNTGLGCSPYFYFDNLILNTSAAFANMHLNKSGLTCLNNIELNSHVDTAGGSWQWYRNGIAITGQTDSILNVSANNLGAGYYTARYSVGQECQLIGDSVISDGPRVQISSHQNANCQGGNDGSASTTISGGYGSITYQWNTLPPQFSTNVSHLNAGTYIVTAKDSEGCISKDTVVITELHPSPVVQNVQALCSGSVYAINGHSYSVNGVYHDTLQTVNGCDSVIVSQLTFHNSYTTSNPQWLCQGSSYAINNHVYSVSGIYHDTLQSLTGCDSIIETNIFTASSNQAIHQVNICNGESYSVNSHIYNQPGIYSDTLFTSHGCDSIVTTNLSISPAYVFDNLQSVCNGESYHLLNHSYSNAGTYLDTIQATNGCDSVIRTELTVKQRPLVTFIKPDDVCVDAAPFELSGGNPPGGIYYGTGVSNNKFIPANASTGIHLITYSYTDGLSGCSNTVDREITVNALPEIQFMLNPKVAFLANSKITFLDYTPNATMWKWDFGDGGISEERYGFHMYKDTGYYRVTIDVVDHHGCMSSTSDKIYIGLEFVYNVPNAFTPNGDGVNDGFRGIGIGVGKYHIEIYNRWGKEVFSSDDIFEAWDGKDAIEDTYVYKVNLEDITGRAYEYVGAVTLLK